MAMEGLHLNELNLSIMSLNRKSKEIPFGINKTNGPDSDSFFAEL
jgi:hypothetical protein